MISRFSVKKPLTIIMAVIAVIVLGGVSVSGMTTDLFPSINLPYAVIITSYESANPERVEMFLTKPIEQSMASVSNVSEVSSTSSEETSIVILEFTQGTDMDTVVLEMRESLDMMMSYMPDEVSSPMIVKLNPDMMPVMVMSVGVEGEDIEQSSQWLDTNIIPEFDSVEGVASVSPSGLITNRIHVVLDDKKIDEINEDINDKILAKMKSASASMELVGPMPTNDIEPIITKNMISGMLMGQNFSMPSGYLTDENKNYLVRIGEKLETIDAIEDIPIYDMEGMPIVYLKDVANVAMTNDADTIYTKVNSNDAVMLTIQKQTEYATSDVSKSIHEKIEELEDEYDELLVSTIMDQGEYIDMVVNGVAQNLIFGAILAVLILLIFLRDIRPTFIVGMAIPISIITAFVLMYFSGITLNIISMGGLALGVGMLVDNSIVVIENIYRMRNEGKSAKKAAIAGTKQVAGAITASTLTTICVFLPIVFTEGITREIFTDMGLTIAFSLLASLVVALSFVPMAASRLLKKQKTTKVPKLTKIQKFYDTVLRFSLKNKAMVIILVILLFAGSIFLAYTNGTEYFPATDSGEININVELDSTNTYEDSVKIIDEINSTLSRIDEIETIGTTMGNGMMMSIMGGSGSGGNADSATIYVLLDEDRESSSTTVAQEIRDLTQDIDAILTISASSMDISAMSGGAIVVNVSGKDFDVLEDITYDIENIIDNVDGTTEINNGISKGAPELQVLIDKKAAIKYSLTSAQVFQVIDAFLADDRSVTTVSNSDGDYDVYVIDEEKEIRTKNDLENLMITTYTGETIKLSKVADIVETVGYSSINRLNQQRNMTVTAEIEDDYNIGKIASEIQDELDDYDIVDGYRVTLVGENEMITESFDDLYLLLILAVLLIYMIMSAQFQSLKSPFIVMFTIPLAFTGGFLGLTVTGLPISIVSFVGMIILSGVVVNNGIVLVDYINKLREEGLPLRKAIIKAGHARLRPIVMTALTTIFALSTMTVGMGMGVELMQPMAITAVGGLIYATLLTLIFVPVLYEAFNPKSKKEKVKS